MYTLASLLFEHTESAIMIACREVSQQVTAVLEAAEIDPAEVVRDLQAGQETKCVQRARLALEVRFRGHDPYARAIEIQLRLMQDRLYPEKKKADVPTQRQELQTGTYEVTVSADAQPI